MYSATKILLCTRAGILGPGNGYSELTTDFVRTAAAVRLKRIAPFIGVATI